MKIRKATKKDLPKLADLIIEEFSKPPYKDKWTKKAAMKSIKFDFEIGNIDIAVENKVILGYVSFFKDQYYKPIITLGGLVVNSIAQRKGVGKKLMNHIQKIGKSDKYPLISLSTNKKSSAYNFYKNLGFKENKNIITMTKKLRV